MPKIASTLSNSFDAFDRAILEIVQRNNQVTHAVIGDQVGLSGSAVRRRLARLRAAGVIRKDVALLDLDQLGVSLVVSVTFDTETPEIYAAFEQQVAGLPEVQQCYHIAGDQDFLLIVHAPSLQYFEEWAKAQFMRNEAIRRYSTTVIWSCKKFETAVPVR
ncbi:MAG: Lrp/AsnC family transcriptional regulator [Hyphomonas sp.]|uniref:Lrp/AsnC family transcriptional regulator n=1 Tax=Hyphomonas sp. TaxID=87 RepID=UPI0017D627F5|nr:Lrp/AsnC family transcriptional regulator [Hyphomonas sp.]MBA3070259.1 Lrp/AsnC family transcriptional regulator [Hyphomonas sp.]MBU3919406.1 Lrp/AsnC family transcriptional regulator [Alphaproteobacteria bacterium]MBU4062744.1 Lrp/AsnC family transcriptional regulator [Alphaproteobacteria bacterium]MBU4163663.1 Lrp/AsnC family transcriptional regulator [Alphaproteobacteria bacterium]